MQESVDYKVGEVMFESLAQISGFPLESLPREADIPHETGERGEGLKLGKAQHVGRLVDLAPVAVEDALMGIVGEQDRDLGGARELGARQGESLADRGFGDGIEPFRPVAGLDIEGDLERRDGAQLALSSLAVAPS